MDKEGASRWQKIIEKHEAANFLQSPEWAEVYESIGDRTKVVFDGDGLALGIIKDARRGRYMEVPDGPLVDFSDREATTALIEKLKEQAREEKCVFIRIRPRLKDTPEDREILKRIGGRRAPMHLHAENTVIIDLGKTEAELLAAMRKQTRYEVKKAEKMGVKVSHDESEKYIDKFCKMQKATAERQGFVPFSPKFIKTQFKIFSDKIRLYRAEYEGEIIAMAIIMMVGGEADYAEAASTSVARKVPAAYALQWRIMRDMKKAGFSCYNMFGVAPTGVKTHRYSGITTFKTGFGGERVDYVPAHDIVLNWFRYLPNYVFETIRRKRRRL